MFLGGLSVILHLREGTVGHAVLGKNLMKADEWSRLSWCPLLGTA